MQRTLLVALALAGAAGALEAQQAPNVAAPRNAARRVAAVAEARNQVQTQETAAPAPRAGQAAGQPPSQSAGRPAARPAAGVAAASNGPTPAGRGPAGSSPTASRSDSVRLGAGKAGTPKTGAPAPAAGGKPGAARDSVAPRVPIAPQPAAPGPGAPRRGPTGTTTVSVDQSGPDPNQVSFEREVFEYRSEARRDPFVSLLATGDLRPVLGDLRLVAVAYDPTGRNSVAVMRDVGTPNKDQYRVKVGQTIGRMRVTQIQPKVVVFTIEEFGYSRQETLALGDSTQTRNAP